MFKKLIVCVVLILSVNTFAKTDIRFAVLAPEGSTWINLMKDFNNNLAKETKGELSFKIFPGGVSGDEFDVIRKMRIGKVDSAGFTGVGLGQIIPAIRVLELPRLFDNYAEIDYVTSKMKPYFEKEFEKKGYVLLGWAEVGFVNIFANKKIDSLASMEGVKMWAWEGDPLAKTLFEDLKLVPNPMPVTDVFTSLQTGLINGVYISPLGAIAMQWFTKTKYMNTQKLTNATGAVLMTTKSFNQLPKDKQVLLKKRFAEFCDKLIKASRADNEKAYNTLKKNNITFVDLKADDVQKFENISKGVWKELTGKLYSQDVLNMVLKYRDEIRNKKPNVKQPKK